MDTNGTAIWTDTFDANAGNDTGHAVAFTSSSEVVVAGEIYVPIGLGSGICGCILARDLLGLPTEIVGVQSTEAPAYALSFAAGEVVTVPTANTKADGMATRIPDPAALTMIRRGAGLISRWRKKSSAGSRVLTSTQD